MKDIEAAEKAITEANGGRFRLWEFSPTHSTFTFRIHRLDGSILEVVCFGCSYYAGGIHWEEAAITVESAFDKEREVFIHVLTDQAAGFKLECLGVVAQEIDESQ